MILKELDPFRGSEADVAARLQADRMAYCLRRHFRRSAEFDVLNGLRIPSGDVVATVDHLLLHPFGFLLVAREPLSGAIQIDGEGRWQRWQQGQHMDAGAPITRAYVQLLLLKSALDRRAQQRGFFDRLELDVLVVVPDEVPIQWPPSGPLVEVCRREEVFDRAVKRLMQFRTTASGPGPLTPAERRVLGEFLCRTHSPEP